MRAIETHTRKLHRCSDCGFYARFVILSNGERECPNCSYGGERWILEPGMTIEELKAKGYKEAEGDIPELYER